MHLLLPSLVDLASEFESLDLAKHVTLVDLVAPDNLNEKNIVRAGSSPSISSTEATAYPITMATAQPRRLPNLELDGLHGYEAQGYALPGPSSSGQSHQVNGNTLPPFMFGGGSGSYGQSNHHMQSPFDLRFNQQQYPQSYNTSPSVFSRSDHRSPTEYSRSSYSSQYSAGPSHSLRPEARGSTEYTRSSNGQSGNVTKNLIGTAVASAHMLHDLNKNEGLWFVFQDLSVRTEGFFRLKFTMYDLKEIPTKFQAKIAANPKASHSDLKEISPVLAVSYSDVFQVYSAKKFPGVIESTDLSKEFAKQGVKIPIRKDGPSKNGNGKRRRQDEEDDSGEGEEY